MEHMQTCWARRTASLSNIKLYCLLCQCHGLPVLFKWLLRCLSLWPCPVMDVESVDLWSWLRGSYGCVVSFGFFIVLCLTVASGVRAGPTAWRVISRNFCLLMYRGNSTHLSSESQDLDIKNQAHPLSVEEKHTMQMKISESLLILRWSFTVGSAIMMGGCLKVLFSCMILLHRRKYVITALSWFWSCLDVLINRHCMLKENWTNSEANMLGGFAFLL